MKRLRILAVGRLKTPCWLAAAAYYQQRLHKSLRLEESLVKDADPGLPLEARKRQEGERLRKQARPGEMRICLDENGRGLTSPEFAALLGRAWDRGRTPCFIIGGAYGLDAATLEAAELRLSLGPLTLPHELARIVLLEQLYRAENILAGTGYHH